MTNAFKQALVGTYSSSDTVIELASISSTITNADYLPDPASGEYNLVIYDGLFGNPADARNAGSYEIVRVTGIDYSENEITVTRAQENTSAITIGAGSFQAIFSATVKTFEDIQAGIDSKEPADATILKEGDVVDNLTSTDTDKPLSANQGKQLQDTKVSKTSDTGSAVIPAGTEAQRDGSPEKGYFRYNEDEDTLEFFDGDDWQLIPRTFPFSAIGGTITEETIGGVDYRIHTFLEDGDFITNGSGEVEYLIIAGGGGGAGEIVAGGGTGGGGAGGYLTNVGGTKLSIGSDTFPVVVGGGGSGGVARTTAPTNGGNSSVFELTAIGGGRGANFPFAPNTGGSGGGGNGVTNNLTGASGTSGQGNSGGNGAVGGNVAGGGGGGADSAGGNNSGDNGGSGGDGITINIDGTSTPRAGGGGGGSTSSGTGGSATAGGGAGGSGGGSGAGSGANATPNTGGGGGGANGSAETVNGGDGGSGIVIIRYEI